MEQLLWELQGHMPWGNCHCLVQSSSTTAFPTGTFGDAALGIQLGTRHPSCPCSYTTDGLFGCSHLGPCHDLPAGRGSAEHGETSASQAPDGE